MLKTLAIAASATLIGLAGASAQTSTSPSKTAPAAQKMTQAECSSAWSRANPANASSLKQDQAKSYVTDFSGADSNKDGSLSRAEFLAACEQGKVTNSATTGAGSGASGTGGTTGTTGTTGKAK